LRTCWLVASCVEFFIYIYFLQLLEKFISLIILQNYTYTPFETAVQTLCFL
jgi:hypothetical protein